MVTVRFDHTQKTMVEPWFFSLGNTPKIAKIAKNDPPKCGSLPSKTDFSIVSSRGRPPWKSRYRNSDHPLLQIGSHIWKLKISHLFLSMLYRVKYEFLGNSHANFANDQFWSNEMTDRDIRKIPKATNSKSGVADRMVTWPAFCKLCQGAGQECGVCGYCNIITLLSWSEI